VDKEQKEKQDKVWVDTMHVLDKVIRLTREAIECEMSKDEIDTLMRVQNDLYTMLFKTEKLGGEK